jgi:hypothetical protein
VSSVLEDDEEDWALPFDEIGVVGGAVVDSVLLEVEEARRAKDAASDPAVGSVEWNEDERVERCVVGEVVS